MLVARREHIDHTVCAQKMQPQGATMQTERVNWHAGTAGSRGGPALWHPAGYWHGTGIAEVAMDRGTGLLDSLDNMAFRAGGKCTNGRQNQCISASQPWHTLPLKHVVESQQFDLDSLDVIFDTALEMENIRPGTPESKQLEGIVMSTLFYEPSTRTRLSFESAMSRLGGTVLSTESAGEYSSAAKGETLEGERLTAS
jgi:Aspartate/ornithine carbamoyltransferase, carbamoyl-P binding domain